MHMFAAIVAANTTWHEINVIAQKCWGMLAGNIVNNHLAPGMSTKRNFILFEEILQKLCHHQSVF